MKDQGDFNPGFRLSRRDALVLAAGVILAASLASVDWLLGAVFALPVAQFFLFCNVFRVARKLELVWAGGFVALTSAMLVFGIHFCVFVLAGSAALGAAVILVEMRKPSYHGVWWKRVNPDLEKWWEGMHVAK